MNLSKETYIYGPGAHEAQRLALQTNSEKKFLLSIMDMVGIRPNQRIFDFGSGNGSVALLLASRVEPKGNVVGIEIDPERVDISRQQAKEKGIHNVSYIQGDILQPLNLPLPKGNVAWSNYVAAHLGQEGTLKMAKNMKQAVKEDGTVAIHDITGWKLQGITKELHDQFNKIWTTSKSLYGVDSKIGTRLDDILKEVELKNIKRFDLIHNSFNRTFPKDIIKDWEMRLSAPGFKNAAITALGDKKNADIFTDKFLQWMKLDDPRKHMHTETVLAIGIK